MSLFFVSFLLLKECFLQIVEMLCFYIKIMDLE